MLAPYFYVDRTLVRKVAIVLTQNEDGPMKTCTWIPSAIVCFSLVGVAACDGGGDEPAPGDGDGDNDGTGGDTGPHPYPSDFVEGGLGESGDWRGYVFTAAEESSTIEPEEFLGDVVCADGLLAAGFEEWALVGWNIAQEIDEETLVGGAVSAIVPGGTGVAYNVVNLGTSGLRIQIQADDMGAESWCAPLPDENPGVIPWGDFKKSCWTTGGEVYDPSTPLAQIAVQTYSFSDTQPTGFEYCVIHLGPAE